MLTNIKLRLNQLQENLSWPGIIDARARYRAAAWQLRNTGLDLSYTCLTVDTVQIAVLFKLYVLVCHDIL